jgi:transposase-like protein
MTIVKLRPALAEIKSLLSADKDFLKPLVRAVVQEVLEAEMTEALGAAKGERIEGRLGYRSGHYSRSLVTRIGKIELRVPQDRQGRFSTELFERYQRSEKALMVLEAEMTEALGAAKGERIEVFVPLPDVAEVNVAEANALDVLALEFLKRRLECRLKVARMRGL